MQPEFVAAIDLGSDAIKCVVADVDHPSTLSLVARIDTPISGDQDGVSEFDPETWTEAIDQAITALLSYSVSHDRALRVIGVTGQVGGALLLDQAGRLKRPALTWADRRAVVHAAEFAEHFHTQFEDLLGHSLPPHTCWSAPKLRRLRQLTDQATVRVVLQAPDYLFYRLTGCVGSVASIAISLAHQAHQRYAQPMIDWTGWRLDQFPPLDRQATCQPLSAFWANMLPGEAPRVVLCGPDMVCGMVGIDARLGDAMIQAGTTEIAGAWLGDRDLPARPESVIRLPIPRLDAPPGDANHAASPTHLVYGSTSNGGMSLGWLEKQLSQSVLEEALWKQAARLEPDPQGPVFIPHVQGARSPWWRDDATGGFFGSPGVLRDPARSLRAVLEGCAMSKRSVFEAIGVAGRQAGRRLLVAGGGARQALANRIRADVIGAATLARRGWEVTAAGACAIALARTDHAAAGVGGAWLARLHETTDSDTFNPDPVRREAYDRLYARYLEHERRVLGPGSTNRNSPCLTKL